MKYRIPVTVIVLGEVLVEAHNFEDAKAEALTAASEEWRDMDLNEISIAPGTSEHNSLER